MAVTAPVNVLVLVKSPAPVTVGSMLNYALEATGGKPPYTWSLISEPPPGITLMNDGRLYGVAEMVGRFPIRVRATDSTREKNSDTALLQVVVNDDMTLQVKTSSLPDIILRSRYETVIAATGGTPPLMWSLVPGDMLPDGFYLVPGDGKKHPKDDGVIYGSTVHAGARAFTVRVEDTAGRRADKLFLLETNQEKIATAGGCGCRTGSDPGPSEESAAYLVLALAALLVLIRAVRRTPS
jgi:MYXO-CTERM domain-containing protein